MTTGTASPAWFVAGAWSRLPRTANDDVVTGVTIVALVSWSGVARAMTNESRACSSPQEKVAVIAALAYGRRICATFGVWVALSEWHPVRMLLGMKGWRAAVPPVPPATRSAGT